ncbi:aminotransferase-like domain-containing protein [Cetobacterium sp.]|uniref:aminotransferase-like domain-containing protein n=1 Tax=Cetobacterium sp. TaxID=2071632 RepID=UPI002FC5EFC4
MKKGSCLDIYEYLKEKILSGNLKAGDKLPSLRQISTKRKINTTTVLKAYEMLEREGYIFKVLGKGSFVSKNRDYSINNNNRLILDRALITEEEKKNLIDFSKDEIDLIKLIGLDLRNIMLKVLILNDDIFESENLKGNQLLRELISDYLEDLDIFVSKEEILVLNSSQQCLNTILKLFFKKKGDITIIVSNPTKYKALNLFKERVNVKGVHLLDDGWDFNDFENILKNNKIDFIYESFNYQNPSGIIWSNEKKERLIELAQEYDFYIIEEDNNSDFYYLDEEPKSLKSYDRAGRERVFYIKDLSKYIHWEMKISYMVIPPIFRERLDFEVLNSEITPGNFTQKILEYLIQSGLYKESLIKLREKMKDKYIYMLNRLNKMKGVKLMHSPGGGRSIWIKLNKNIDEKELYHLCKKQKVSFLPGTIFYWDKREESKIRLSFVGLEKDTIEEGLNIIERAIKEITDKVL